MPTPGSTTGQFRDVPITPCCGIGGDDPSLHSTRWWRPSGARRQPNLSRMLKNPCERCHSDPAVAGEESRSGNLGLTRFLAEFTLSGQSEILRCAQDDSEGLGMTG